MDYSNLGITGKQMMSKRFHLTAPKLKIHDILDDKNNLFALRMIDHNQDKEKLLKELDKKKRFDQTDELLIDKVYSQVAGE
jgi:hypothetical protein